MLSKDFQRKIYAAYKEDDVDGYIKHGKYLYSIAYNSCCTIHTWVIRRKRNGVWHWLQPLDPDIN